MKKLILLFVLLATGLAYQSATAQVRVGVGIDVVFHKPAPPPPPRCYYPEPRREVRYVYVRDRHDHCDWRDAGPRGHAYGHYKKDRHYDKSYGKHKRDRDRYDRFD